MEVAEKPKKETVSISQLARKAAENNPHRFYTVMRFAKLVGSTKNAKVNHRKKSVETRSSTDHLRSPVSKQIKQLERTRQSLKEKPRIASRVQEMRASVEHIEAQP